MIDDFLITHTGLLDYNILILDNQSIFYQHNNKFKLDDNFVIRQELHYFYRSWTLYIRPSNNRLKEASLWSNISIFLAGLLTAIFIVSLSAYSIHLKSLHEERSKLQLKIDKIDSLKTLAGGMAHDFNNILMIIEGNKSIIDLERDNLSPSSKESLRAIDSSLHSGQDLTKQIMAYSKNKIYESIKINLIDLVRENLELFESSLDKNIEVSFRTESEVAFIQANKSKISQIILNVLNNSAQAIRDIGSIHINIYTWNHKGKQNYVSVSINDTGSGIPEDVINKVFDPFFTTKPKGKGNGFGLSLAYQYLTSIDGTIEVKSREGYGTSVVIIIPLVDRQHY